MVGEIMASNPELEEILAKRTLAFKHFVEEYGLTVNYQDSTLTINHRINDWNDFYAKAYSYGFRYVGNRKLIIKDDTYQDDYIQRLYKLNQQS